MLKKVLFSDDKNTQQVHNICCSGIKIDLQYNFIVMIFTTLDIPNHLNMETIWTWIQYGSNQCKPVAFKIILFFLLK